MSTKFFSKVNIELPTIIGLYVFGSGLLGIFELATKALIRNEAQRVNYEIPLLASFLEEMIAYASLAAAALCLITAAILLWKRYWRRHTFST